MTAINRSPSGPFFRGTEDGQVPVWNASVGEWQASFSSGVDYVISSRADLLAVVAPVSGAFNLPVGAYFIKQDITLNDGEYLVASNIEFVSNDKTVSGNPPASFGLFNSNSFPKLRSVNFISNNAQPAIRLSGSTLVINGGFAISILGNAVEITANAILKAFDFQMYGAGSAIDMVAGRAYLVTCLLNSGSSSISGACIRMTNSVNSKRIYAVNCDFSCFGSAVCLDINSSTGSTSLVNCLITVGGAGIAPVVLTLARNLTLNGCAFTHQGGGSPVGVRINGAVDSIILDGNTFESYAYACRHSAGVVDRATFLANDMNNISAGLIDWAAANIPTNGLLIMGNQVDGANFFTGFTQSSARVNAKANSRAGALVSETAIVP